MSTMARHHAEWLSLLEISGPFLSVPVLLTTFPQGLEAQDPDHKHYGLENTEHPYESNHQ